MKCQVKDELVSQLMALNNKLNLLSPDLCMGTKNARKCNNDVRACTLRSSTTGRRGTMGNRAPRQDGFRPVTAAWLGKRIGAEVRGQNGPIFDHFPNSKCFDFR